MTHGHEASQVAKQPRLVAVHKLGQRAAVVVVAATCNICIFSFNLLQVAGSMQQAVGSMQQQQAKLSKFHFGLLLAHLSGNENISQGLRGSTGGEGAKDCNEV